MLVAISVTMIGILGLYSVFIYAINMNIASKHKSIAYHLASQEMEILRNTDYTVLNNQTEGTFLGTISGFDTLPSSSGKLTIENYGASADIKKISIKVIWQERGSQKQVDLNTLISRFGM